MIINSEGIVLRQRKIANNRRMIVLFTKRYGKLSAGTSINEKSKSRSALALRPFTYAEYDIFKGRETYSINSSQVLKSFYSIGEDIDRFIMASSFIEYLDKVLAEGEPMPHLFDLSLEFLESVSHAGKSAETLLLAYIYKTLKMLGVAPELTCCVNCGKKPSEFGGNSGIRSFSVTSGGIICDECAKEEKINPNALIYKPSFDIITVFVYFDSKPLKTFEKIDLKPEVLTEVRAILAEYIDRYLGTDVLRQSIGPEV
ncbi:MAG: DNA repair protein RecO [Mogibacterium sp.]|nr:DNA repair protein RecO [Mogibacterium sp.]